MLSRAVVAAILVLATGTASAPASATAGDPPKGAPAKPTAAAEVCDYVDHRSTFEFSNTSDSSSDDDRQNCMGAAGIHCHVKGSYRVCVRETKAVYCLSPAKKLLDRPSVEPWEVSHCKCPKGRAGQECNECAHGWIRSDIAGKCVTMNRFKTLQVQKDIAAMRRPWNPNAAASDPFHPSTKGTFRFKQLVYGTLGGRVDMRRFDDMSGAEVKTVYAEEFLAPEQRWQLRYWLRHIGRLALAVKRTLQEISLWPTENDIVAPFMVCALVRGCYTSWYSLLAWVRQLRG